MKTKLLVLTLVALGSLFLGQAVFAEDPTSNQVGRVPQTDSLQVVADLAAAADLATAADLEREGSRIDIAFVLNDQEEPAVAYSLSSGQYLVVYQSSANSGNILGRYVDADTGGRLGSNVFAISSTAAAERSPDVVYDPHTDRFLVVWEEQRCLGIPQKCYWGIKGRLLHGTFQGEGASNLAGDAFTVSSEHSTLVAGYDHRDPAVAYNAAGEYYMVVFLRGQESTGDYHGVRGQMLHSSAIQPTVEFGLEGFVIQSYSTYTASTPDVAWAPGSDGFLTTWATTRAEGTRYVAIAYVWDQPVPGGQVIRTWQVAPLDWGEYPLTHDCLAPAVAYDPVYDAYLVVFEHWVGGEAFANYTIYGTWLTPINHSEGVSIGSAFPIETEVSETRDTHHQPDVVFSDHSGKMHVTYRTVDYIINEDFLHTVYARSVYRRTVGDRLDVSNTVFPERDVENPAIASAGNGRSFIVWSEEYSQGDKDIYGQRIRPVGGPPTPTPTREPTYTPIIPDTPTPTLQPTNTPIAPNTPTPTATPTSDQKLIMFDETHGERNTLSWQRAQELVPDHPEWVYFGDLFWGLSPEFVLTSIQGEGPITYEMLSGYDAVIFSAPEWPFTEAELIALARYLSSGRGMLVIGDSGMGEAVESLTSPHGVTLNPYVLFAPGSEGDFAVTDFVDHPALASTDSLVTNWGGSLVVDSPAVPLIYTPPDIRRDVNQNDQYDTSDPAGRFTIAAARESGPVRVVVTSDNPFQNDGYEHRDNEDFVRSVLRWLTAERPAYAHNLAVPLVLK